MAPISSMLVSIALAPDQPELQTEGAGEALALPWDVTLVRDALRH
jgi:hypothetical protein